MITFKNFISEEVDAYTPTELSDAEFVSWCETHCANYLKAAGATRPIMRGMAAPRLGLIDSSKMNRKSANTRNYYTVWMDSDKSWAKYPKRSKSLICATSRMIALGFGTPNLLFPADSNLIGVCSDDDLWTSFPHREKRLPVFSTMSSFISAIHTVARASADLSSTELAEAETYYTALMHMLEILDLETLEAVERDSPPGALAASQFIAAFEKYGYRDMQELWRDLLDPTKNKFRVETAATYSAKPMSELWVQGPTATMKYATAMHALENPDTVLGQFLADHSITRF